MRVRMRRRTAQRLAAAAVCDYEPGRWCTSDTGAALHGDRPHGGARGYAPEGVGYACSDGRARVCAGAGSSVGAQQ